MKRIISVILAFVLAFGVFGVLCNAEEKDEMNFLLLGDSIAQGYGVENKNVASYGAIVAATNGWNYKNYARVAYDTKDFIEQITENNEIINAIKEADIINICTGSNNYLANKDVVKIVIGAIFHINTKLLDDIADEIYSDYEIIYATIRQLNPDAVIIFNKIYCAWKGFGHIPFNQAVVRINAQIDKLSKNHSDIILFETGDVLTHNSELIADDCVHPNADGNVALAKALLKLMKDNDLCENTEPVISEPGINYNFYIKSFGAFAGRIIYAIVKVLTWNF